MSEKENKISVQKTARFYTLGNASHNVKSIWFVLHGYGNSGSDFIKEFDVLDNGENFIVVPEALNKFYLKGFFGKVGASWMTKENREDEIDDYVNFLNSVYETVIKNFKRNEVKINVLGFSQGVPAAVRWMTAKNLAPDNFIIWAGDIPGDTEPGKIKSVLKDTGILYVIGSNDRIIDRERFKIEADKIKGLGLNYKAVEFNGGHKIDRPTLTAISEEYLKD